MAWNYHSEFPPVQLEIDDDAYGSERYCQSYDVNAALDAALSDLEAQNRTQPWYDDTTSFTSASESDVPAWTEGNTLESSSQGYQAYVSQDIRLLRNDGVPCEYQDRSSLVLGDEPKESAPQVDLQFIGGAPEARLPKELPQFNDDVVFSTGNQTAQEEVPDAIPASYHFHAQERDGDLPTITVSRVAAPPSEASQHMRRNYTEDERIKVAAMRGTGACVLCRTRRYKCDPGLPCSFCNKVFSGRSEACIRKSLLETLPKDNQPNPWAAFIDCDRAVPGNWQLCDACEQRAIVFDRAPNSPTLILRLDVYCLPTNANANAYNSLQSMPISEYSMPNSGTRSGVYAAPYYSSYLEQSQSQVHLRLGANTQPSKQDILQWIQTQLARDLPQTHNFDAKLTALILLLVNKPLPTLAARSTTVMRRTTSNTNPFSPRYLLRGMCELICWVRLWNTETLYHRDAFKFHQLPSSVVGGLKQLALPWLVEAEQLVLSSLDNLLARNAGIQSDELLPVWACLMQTILLYRMLLQTATNQGGLGQFIGGTQHIATVLSTTESLYQLLLTKYSAYFGSSSPVYPRKSSTEKELAEDPELQKAWTDVMKHREAFYGEILQSTSPYDNTFRMFVVDLEDKLKRRRSRARCR